MGLFRKLQRIPVRIHFEISRALNQRHRYDFPPENNGWEKVGTKPVFGDLTTGTMFDPFVYVEGEKFIMVLSERTTGSLVRIESYDGENWSDKTTILTGIPNTWESAVNRASLVHKDNKWHLWYTGRDGRVSKIGYATSDDGIHFIRQSKFPVLYPETEQEGESVMNPHVIWNSKKDCYQMWYAAGEDYEPDVLFYAESNDGQSWKNRRLVLSKDSSHEWEKTKVGGCHVVLNEKGLYTMYYIGYQNVDVARICEAISEDGINWNRSKNNLLIGPTRNSWDADAVYKPSVVVKDNCCYMWYNGRKSHREYIGLATRNINENEI